MTLVVSFATGAVLGASLALGLRLRRGARRGPEPGSEAIAERSVAILAAAAHDTIPAIVIGVTTGASCPAHLVAADPEQTQLSLAPEGFSGTAPGPGSVVLVQFNADGRTRLFSAPVARLDAGTLVLGTPTHIADAEARGAYRLVVEPGLVEVAALVGDRLWEGWATDVSMTGLGIEFPASACPELSEGAELELRLIHAGREAQRTAKVRRAQAPQFGLQLRGGDANEPDPAEQAYRELVAALGEGAA